MKYSEIFGNITFNTSTTDFLVDLWNRYLDNKSSSLKFLYMEHLGTDDIQKDLFLNSDSYKILELVRNKIILQGEDIGEIFVNNSLNYRNCILDAMKKIMQIDNNSSYSIKKLINHILVAENEHLKSTSSSKFIGIIVLAPTSEWSIYNYIENIIHEVSHIELYIMQLLDNIIIKPELIDSPFRKYKRPVLLVFHACFVLSKIINFLINMKSIDNSQELCTRIRLNLNMLTQTINSLQLYSHFTNNGKLLFNAIKKNYSIACQRI
jgi:hypothetical protein